MEKLARVRWKMGQTLLPEHFQALEESVGAEAALRFQVHGLPAYGVAGLAFIETAVKSSGSTEKWVKFPEV